MTKKLIKYKFKKQNTIQKEEIRAALKVLKSGKLSGFMGSAGSGFYGGKYVKKFEDKVKNFYKVKHAITVNSWTSGLITMIGSLDIEPGDEIIVSPWTMCATATAILHWNCVPVFADIDENDFCISAEDIRKKITKKTKAIIAVDIFGFPADLDSIKKIIKGKNIKILSDNAQAPYAIYNNKISGTNADMGGFSFNYHKHINTGEGGVIITNSSYLARRARLIRNHGEAVVKEKENIKNILGYNFRLGEIESAIGFEQYKKLKKIIKKRQMICRYLTKRLNKLKGLKLPQDSSKRTHNYYIYPIILDLKNFKFNRSGIIKLLKKQGIQGLIDGYANIHKLPMYKKKIAYGSKGFPWSHTYKNFKKNYYYKCQVAEELQNKTFIGIEVCLFDLNIKDIDLIAKSFEKVWKKIIK